MSGFNRNTLGIALAAAMGMAANANVHAYTGDLSWTRPLRTGNKPSGAAQAKRAAKKRRNKK